MGKSKNTWLSAVKKAFSASPKDSSEPEPHKDTSSNYFLKDGKKEIIATQERKSSKERNRWSFRRSSQALQPSDQLHLQPGNDLVHLDEPPNGGGGHTGDSSFLSNNIRYEKSYGHNENQNKHALAVAVATAAAAEAAVAAAQAAAQVAKLTGTGRSGRNGSNATPRASNFARRNREELAAIRIQAAFRAYLARRTFRTLKGLARLQALAQGHVGQRQTTATMRCMQALVRAQAAVRGRRTTRLCEEMDTTHDATLLHPPWEQWEPRRSAAMTADISEKGYQDDDDQRGPCEPEWDDRIQTIEQIQARELAKQEAAVKRERAMAYAFSHQQLNASNQPDSKASMTPQLGWNWLERWMAARPWENRRPSPAKETATPRPQRQPSPLRRGSAPATPAPSSFRQCTTPRTASPGRRTASVTPVLSSFSAPATRLNSNPLTTSSRAHSLASSSMRDDLSVASFSGTPSYMASTESARAKLRSHSTPKQRPAVARSAATSVYSDDGNVQQQQQQPASRKRLSFANADSASARNFLSWRTPPLQRNPSFESYTKTKSFSNF
eukprot:c23077_g2_i3 orf=694-2358(-)